ncbi:glycosyl transferase family protein [Sphingomonas sp.]|uniref:glycosyl transferase family protein n=1 Tax=Sphingomonas sp. TaxID=28214 RepID=UPI002D80D987|nr:glycosyl transferase family protein [Sphingomonas sp.]HEU0045339.1 glycosyl transferase family protein [Sphingomonas sp.]
MGALELWDALARELMLFAAVGLLIGGIDDLAMDLLYWSDRLLRPRRRLTIATLPPVAPMRFAVFVPAWDEAAVIGPMLRTALDRFAAADCRIYVGVYPNDWETQVAVAAVDDDRIRIVLSARAGPTTKADNLNSLWHGLEQDGWTADAIVIHDAEDVVHRDELTVFGALLGDHDVVQLPVLPIVARGSRLLSGHYADEFAESHAKSMVVRTALGAGMPLAGTGCAIRTHVLGEVAQQRGGVPFDADSLVEDYELGLKLAGQGGRGCFARVREHEGGAVVAVRALFPGELKAAVWQKARWMTGIALAGWDRTGWARPAHLSDHWMRLRDRRAPLAMLVLAVAYLAMLAWGSGAVAHWTFAVPAPALSSTMAGLLAVNGAVLFWRLGMRMLFTGRAYGWREALWSLPRFVVGNAVALLAAPRALLLYTRMLRGGPPTWDKTAHIFPDMTATQR